MQAAAQGWLALELTGKAELLGLVIGLQFLPSLLFSLPAGVWSDRFDRRILLLLTQIGMAISALLMSALIFLDAIHFQQVLVFAFIYGIFSAIDLPVRQAFTVQLSGRENYPSAIALNAFSFNVSRLIGPAIAGIAIATMGMGFSYFINALSFGMMIWVLLKYKIPFEKLEQTQNAIGMVGEGLRYAWNNRTTRQIIILVGLSSIFAFNFQTVVPAYARMVLGLKADGYGLLMSSVGFGALLGAGLQLIRGRGNPGLPYVGSAMVGIFLVGLVFPHSAASSAILFALCGFGMPTALINANSIVQMAAPEQLRGRVMSIYSMVLVGVGPIGAYLTGFLFDHLGGRWTVGILGCATLFTTGWMWLNRQKD